MIHVRLWGECEPFYRRLFYSSYFFFLCGCWTVSVTRENQSVHALLFDTVSCRWSLKMNEFRHESVIIRIGNWISWFNMVHKILFTHTVWIFTQKHLLWRAHICTALNSIYLKSIIWSKRTRRRRKKVLQSKGFNTGSQRNASMISSLSLSLSFYSSHSHFLPPAFLPFPSYLYTLAKSVSFCCYTPLKYFASWKKRWKCQKNFLLLLTQAKTSNKTQMFFDDVWSLVWKHFRHLIITDSLLRIRYHLLDSFTINQVKCVFFCSIILSRKIIFAMLMFKIYVYLFMPLSTKCNFRRNECFFTTWNRGFVYKSTFEKGYLQRQLNKNELDKFF